MKNEAVLFYCSVSLRVPHHQGWIHGRYSQAKSIETLKSPGVSTACNGLKGDAQLNDTVCGKDGIHRLVNLCKVSCWICRGRSIALQIAQGLHFLHSRRIVHMDLKSANILLSREGGDHAKIADVGLARSLNNQCALNPSPCLRAKPHLWGFCS